jgi:hypothetical protein
MHMCYESALFGDGGGFDVYIDQGHGAGSVKIQSGRWPDCHA